MKDKKKVKSVKSITNKTLLRNALIGGIMLASTFSLSGCGKKVDCDIMIDHAHLYKNEDSFDRYIVSEKEYIRSWDRTDEYIQIDEEDKELLEFLKDEKLFSIEDNKEKINKIVNEQEDYIEYRYKYTYIIPIAHYIKTGKTTSVYYTYMPMTGHSWTTDKHHSRLTGEKRTVHHVYYGYKVKTNEKGKLEIVKSKPVDSLNDLPKAYKYIEKDFYEKIDIKKPKKKLDYEDGPEEEKKLDEKQQKNYEKSKKHKNGFVRTRKINC